MQHFEVGEGLECAVVDIHIIYIAELLFHKLEELVVGVNEDDGVLLCDETRTTRTGDGGGELVAGACQEVHLALVVELQTVVSHGDGLRLGIFEIHLHL